MSKRLISSMFFVALLCGPALADRPPPTSSAMQIGLRVDAGKDVRRYGMIVVDGECDSIESKSQAPTASSGSSGSKYRVTIDSIKVCARTGGAADVQLDVEWSMHDADHELHDTSSTLVAHGSSIELDGGTAKLRVSLQ